MKNIIIIGAAGHGKVIQDILKNYTQQFNLVGFLDDNFSSLPSKILNTPILGSLDQLEKLIEEKKIESVVIAIGDISLRKSLFQKCIDLGLDLPNIIHPSSVISESANLGQGIQIIAGVIINPFVTIEDNVIINTASSIDHDCYLEKDSFIAPGVRLAGNVHLGAESFIGINATIIQKVKIGKQVIIGAGTVVLKDLSDQDKVVGNPAQKIN